MNDLIFQIVQIVAAVVLIATILLQQRGGGLSPVFGGEGGFYRTRRGIEKTIFITSIISAAIFFLAAILNLVF
ncbi:MAG: preprotein translocase subunit SecG [Candidatus Sungbacteria bacterium RIFCSPHIGHO2_01_FULL_50_25]|uniref:Protein-export membrane protein SecG n=1 Tax=Candidatus Sungbacteria bacterium RIFCSPHIGHO2_01_FULL_50_25 TaxID=1802265 RepID=A0A1G2K7R2_9BACT|nr:MAG: preprotein translocase subunit SecG [Candidatus Sungbacteria bacterium RIFCSPHIGHO2_01_FULL_50_25]